MLHCCHVAIFANGLIVNELAFYIHLTKSFSSVEWRTSRTRVSDENLKKLHRIYDDHDSWVFVVSTVDYAFRFRSKAVNKSEIFTDWWFDYQYNNLFILYLFAISYINFEISLSIVWTNEFQQAKELLRVVQGRDNHF